MGIGRRLWSQLRPQYCCALTGKTYHWWWWGTLQQQDLDQDQMGKHCGVHIFMWVFGALSVSQGSS